MRLALLLHRGGRRGGCWGGSLVWTCGEGWGLSWKEISDETYGFGQGELWESSGKLWLALIAVGGAEGGAVGRGVGELRGNCGGAAGRAVRSGVQMESSRL